VDDSKTTAPVVSLAFSYLIDKTEIAAARATGVPIEDTKVTEVRKGMAKKENEILFQGDSDANLSGLCDYGTGIDLDNKNWKGAPQNIVEDVHQLWVNVEEQDGFEGRTLLWSDEAWKVANTAYFTSTGPRQSAYDEIVNKGWFENIYKTDKLESGFYDVAVLDNSPENMAAVIPQNMQRLESNEHNLYFQVPVMQRIAGVIVRYDSTDNRAIIHSDADLLTLGVGLNG